MDKGWDGNRKVSLPAEGRFGSSVDVMSRSHLPGALILALSLGLAPGYAAAHEGGRLPEQTPPAPPGDGADAEKILADLDARAQKDEALAKVTDDHRKRVRRALERAHGAKASGDDAHAKMLWGAAKAWANAAVESARAADAERVAAEAGKRARDEAAKAERARALLEETQARRARAEAEIARLEAEAKEAAKAAASAEDQRLKGKGAPPPKAPAPSPKKPAKKGGK